MQEIAFPGFKFQKFSGGGMHPDPPSYAMSLKMLRSDFWLDPPLKTKECLENASETPQTAVLKQLRDTLSEKLEALKLLDKEIVEVLSNSEAEDAEQQLEKEIQETDDTRAELQKIIFDVNDALFEALPPLPHGQSTPSNLSMSATPKQIVRAKLQKLEVKRFKGKIQEWQEFWDSFDSSVNKNDALSDGRKGECESAGYV
jgi:hypothetical protein